MFVLESLKKGAHKQSIHWTVTQRKLFLLPPKTSDIPLGIVFSCIYGFQKRPQMCVTGKLTSKYIKKIYRVNSELICEGGRYFKLHVCDCYQQKSFFPISKPQQVEIFTI